MAITVLVGMVAAAVSTLRINFVPVAVAYLLAAEAGRWAQNPARWRACLRDGAASLGSMAACVLPWALMLYFSSNTLLFPLMKGNLRPEYGFLSGSTTLGEKAAWLGSYYLHVDAILQLIPLAFVLRRRHWADRLPLYVAAIAMAAAVVLAYVHSDFENLYRYAYPSMAAAVLLALAYVVRHARRPVPVVMAFAILAGAVCSDLFDAQWALQDSWTMAVEAFTRPRIFAAPSLVENYRAAQSAVPEGEKVFAAVSFPNFLDYRRQVIYNIDTPGVAGPDPGLPLEQGPAALKAYFQSVGVRYLIVVDPDHDKTIYSRSRWTEVGAQGAAAVETDRVAYPHTMAYIRDITALLKTEDIVYSRGSLRVIRLQ
jgi:hypothetical protein